MEPPKFCLGFAIDYLYCPRWTKSPLINSFSSSMFIKEIHKYFKRSILYCNGNIMFQIEFYEINLIPFHQSVYYEW